jgi:hypothetical protein
MAEKKTKAPSLHDQQTSATAESLRAIINDHNFRGGMTERDTQALKDKLESIAKNLNEQGKTPDEIEEMRDEAGEPDPTKTAAELVREQFNAEDKANEKKNVVSPGQPVDNTVDLGKPAVPSQASTTDRDNVEKTAKQADDKIEKVTSKK